MAPATSTKGRRRPGAPPPGASLAPAPLTSQPPRGVGRPRTRRTLGGAPQGPASHVHWDASLTCPWRRPRTHLPERGTREGEVRVG